jgi:hypothetical protein
VDDLLANREAPDAGTVVASGLIQQRANGVYSLVLTAKSQSRRIEGENCVELAQAAALLLALLVDPSHEAVLPGGAAEMRTEEQEVENRAAEQPAREEPRAESGAAAAQQDRTSTPPARTEKIRLLAEGALRLEVGSWPDARPGAMIGFGLSYANLQALLHASVSQPVRLHSTSGGTLRLFVSAFDLTFSYLAEFGRWGVGPAAGTDLGVMRATSQDLEPAPRISLSLSLFGTIRGSFQATSALRLWLGAGAGYPAVRPRWVVGDGEELHRLGPFLRGQAGVQLEF